MATLPPLGLYIHLPWCERKCPYCDFNSHEASFTVPEQDYVRALLADLDADLPLVSDRVVSTLFIGGGTPSLFSAEAIHTLMQGLEARLTLATDLEATMEANPGSAEAEKFRGFRSAGINRLSLGIQSFQDEQLAALGRVHNSSEAHRAIDAARTAGFDNFNLDLMHGLPGQSEAAAREDLRQALAYQPPHLSWYQLTIEPNTVYYTQPPLLPVEDILADIQDDGEAALAEAGLEQYEVSAYARAGSHSRHNHNYWSFGDYLGIGAGAHGKITGPDGQIQRYRKRRQPTQYLLAKRGEHQAERQLLRPQDLPGEFMLNALRLNQGFHFDQYCARTGLPRESVSGRIEALQDRGLLRQDGCQVRATALGRRFLDSVIGEFFVSP